jgi:hypothetical protein
MQVPWAGPNSRFTEEFELQVIEVLLLARSQSQAAQYLELNWHQVHAVQAAAVRRGLERRDTEDIARVGLDETCAAKGSDSSKVRSVPSCSMRLCGKAV